MQIEAFLSEFSGLLQAQLTTTNRLRVHTWPLVGTADLILAVEMDQIHWSYRICPDHIQQRGPIWVKTYLYGLVLMATGKAG